jgi:xanthine/CO dehydrogenase XdhC/CoxF family maturation factor
MTQIISTFMVCRDGDLIKDTRHVLDSMKSNALFPNPEPTLDVVEKSLGDYTVALSNAGGLDRKLVAVKNKKRAELRELLKELVKYVTNVSKGDSVILIASGFNVSPERSVDAKLPPRVEVSTDEPGQATIQIKRTGRAKAYTHQYAFDPITPETKWEGEMSNSNKHTFTGLPSLTRVWFRVVVLTRTGDKLYWDPVSKVIQ